MSAAELWAVYNTLKGLQETVKDSGLTALIAAINTAKTQAQSALTTAVSADT